MSLARTQSARGRVTGKAMPAINASRATVGMTMVDSPFDVGDTLSSTTHKFPSDSLSEGLIVAQAAAK